MEENKTQIKSRGISRTVLSLIALLTVALSLITSSVAWLSVLRASGDMGFGAGEPGALVLHKGTVVSGGEESSRVFSECSDEELGSFPENNGLYTVTLSDMDFGAIDNLARLKPENIVYLRLTLSKLDGTKISMSFNTEDGDDGYFFDLYRNVFEQDGETVSGQEKLSAENAADKAILDGIQAIKETDGESFLNFSYAFSESAHEQIYDTTLEFSDETPFDGGSSVLAVCPEEIASGDADEYYLYIKITPNLNAFAYSIEYLSPFMPCFLLFHMAAEFEIMTEG